MECTCSCSIDWYGPDVIRITHPISRTEHVCVECGEVIQKGEKYEHVRGLWDGYWDTIKTCWPCKLIRDSFCSSWSYGGLRDNLKYCLGFDYLGNLDEIKCDN